MKLERLTANEENERLVKSFSCQRNPHLADHLKYTAWNEDKEGETAYYIVREDSKVLFYFSLRCNALVEPFTEEDSTKEKCIFMKEAKQKGFLPQKKTFSAVELVQFCKNSNCNKKDLGCHVFFNGVIPLVYALKKIVGCKYLYLYAADLSADSTLVAYYKAKLGFKGLDREKIKPLIPYYDKGCTFMMMELK